MTRDKQRSPEVEKVRTWVEGVDPAWLSSI
jgi:hypothetical protein